MHRRGQPFAGEGFRVIGSLARKNLSHPGE
jgi:hypothetical protein